MRYPYKPPESIERFLSADRTPEEVRGVIRDLLAFAPESDEAGGGAEAWSAARPLMYDEVLRRTMRQAGYWESEMERQKMAAELQWADLRRCTAERRRLRVRNDPRLWTWGLCDHLLDESAEALWDDLPLAVETAELALEVAGRLDEAMYGAERLADLQGLAWSAAAEARRLLGDLKAAIDGLAQARELHRAGTGDPLQEAHLLCREAALLADLGTPEIAAELLDRAIARYRRAGDGHREGRALAQKAGVIAVLDPKRAAFLLWRALSLVDPQRDPRLASRLRAEVVKRGTAVPSTAAGKK